MNSMDRVLIVERPRQKARARAAWELPPVLTDLLQKMVLDKRNVSVELNIKHGQICSFNVREHIEVPRHEIL
jgi:hypothetical protein